MLEFYKNKRIFITGSTGFKGSWLTRVLLNAGASVKGYGLAPNTDKNLFDILVSKKSFETIIDDVRNLERLRREIFVFKPEIVLHMAAQPLVRESYKSPVETYGVNVMGSVNILEACRGLDSLRSFVNITTDKVYLNVEKTEGYTEDEFLCGYDPYSNSKSCSELVTYSYKKSFFNYTGAPAISTARSGNVIGGGDFSADRIIPDCVRAAEKNETIIVRNPDSTRPYQHVLDCLSGYLTLCQQQYQDADKADSYNFGPDDESCISTGKLVDAFCECWKGAEWKVVPDGGPHEANFLKLNCDKAKKMLGWKPKLNIQEAVGLTVDWYKQYNNKDSIAYTDKQINDFFRS